MSRALTGTLAIGDACRRRGRSRPSSSSRSVVGLVAAMRREGGGIATLGVSVRYRYPVRVFDRLTMLTSALGWDERFVYLDQSLWRGAEWPPENVPP